MKLQIRIDVDSEKNFNIHDIYEIMQSFKLRLEGYHTEVPESLIDANLHINTKFSINDVEKELSEEVEKAKNQLK